MSGSGYYHAFVLGLSHADYSFLPHVVLSSTFTSDLRTFKSTHRHNIECTTQLFKVTQNEAFA